MGSASLPRSVAAVALLGAVGACTGEITGLEASESSGSGSASGRAGSPDDPASPGAASAGTGAGTDGAGGLGGTDDPALGPDGRAPVTFECSAGAAALESPAMRRLTERQYRNTVEDLLVRTLGSAQSESLLDGMRAELDTVPADARKQLPQDLHGSYRRLDQDVAQAHVESWFAVASSLGAALSAPALLDRVVGSCATDADSSNDVACIDDFIRRFGELAFRRPLTPQEVSEQRSFYAPSTGIDPAGLADVIAGILSAPQFLYLVEHGAEATASDATVADLNAFELASRLSYHFWETMPDAELFEAARSGTLLELSEYQHQLERLFADPHTRETIRGFTRDWLKLDDVPSLTKNQEAAIFRAFAGENLPDAGLREAMIEEVLDLVDYFTWDDPRGLEAILTTDYSFTRSPELAALYGINPWNGTSPPPSFPAGERPGVLTRGAFLATGTAMTRPIMRGVFFRTNVLCDRIPPPPDNAAANPPVLSDTLSTRQVVEALTEVEGTACAGCHRAYINPIGFTFEGFDALGRLRQQQTLFSEDGLVVGSVPIDTSTAPQLLPGDETPVQGPADLMQMAVESGKAHACVARHYFRFTFGRWEHVARDGCVLESIRSSLTESGNFAQMLKDVAATDAFRQRTFD